MLETREALGAGQADEGSMRLVTEHCSCSRNKAAMIVLTLIEHLQHARPCTKRVACITSLNALDNPIRETFFYSPRFTTEETSKHSAGWWCRDLSPGNRTPEFSRYSPNIC